MANKFEAGKKYISTKSENPIYKCLFVSDQISVLKNLENNNEFSVRSVIDSYWEEYIPPVVYKAYVHWFRWNNGSIGNCILESKKDNPYGHPALHVQEVSFEEKRNA